MADDSFLNPLSDQRDVVCLEKAQAEQMLHLGRLIFWPIPVELIEGFDDGKRASAIRGDRAILASLLSPSRRRPRYCWGHCSERLVSQSLIVFLDEAQTELSQVFCEATFFVIHGGRGF